MANYAETVRGRKKLQQTNQQIDTFRDKILICKKISKG